VARPRPEAIGPITGEAMLVTAFYALGAAVLLGSVLAVWNLRPRTAPPPWPLAALHALVAIGGLAILALALRGPPRGLDQGTASFGIISAVLIGLAALIGGRMLTARLRNQRPASTLIGVHAMLAIGGFVILIAYVLA
jgi:hypothetical protein